MNWCLGSIDWMEFMMKAESSSAKIIISYLETSRFKRLANPGLMVILLPFPKMYSELIIVPVRFNIRVFGWKSGWTVSANSFLEGGWVMNYFIWRLPQSHRWYYWLFLWRYRSHKGLLQISPTLWFSYCDYIRDRYYKKACWILPRKKIYKSTILQCSYFLLT